MNEHRLDHSFLLFFCSSLTVSKISIGRKRLSSHERLRQYPYPWWVFMVSMEGVGAENGPHHSSFRYESWTYTSDRWLAWASMEIREEEATVASTG